jgi:hypothetical protein
MTLPPSSSALLTVAGGNHPSHPRLMWDATCAVRRVAEQLGYGVASVSCVKQANVDDGVRSEVTTSEAERVKDLEQDVPDPPRCSFGHVD